MATHDTIPRSYSDFIILLRSLDAIEERDNPPKFTPEKYFDWEQQLHRHEYIESEVYAMTSGTIDHSDIAGNFLSLLKAHLQGSDCKTLKSDARVSILQSSHYFNIYFYCEFYRNQIIICNENYNPYVLSTGLQTV